MKLPSSQLQNVREIFRLYILDGYYWKGVCKIEDYCKDAIRRMEGGDPDMYEQLHNIWTQEYEKLAEADW